MNWRAKHTAAVIAFIAIFGLMAVLATQLKVTKHNHLGFWSSVLIAALILCLLLVVGSGVAARLDGVLIDSRNRISLSQFQLVVWTLVVLASLGGAFFTNLLADADPLKALNVTVPPELWLALGFSVGTVAGSKGLNAIQGMNEAPAAIPPADAPGGAAGIETRGQLLVRSDAPQASWGDIFASDYVNDALRVDVAKVQMFIFTIILAFTYAAAVANELITSHGQITALPSLDTGFITLLGLSQGGYLATKAVKGST